MTSPETPSLLATIRLQLGRRRALLWAGGVTMVGHVSVALIGLVAIRTLTELAPPATFGEANLLLSALALLVSLFVAPFTNTQLRYHTAAFEAGDGDRFTAEVLSWVLAATALICALGLMAYPVWRNLTGHSYNAVAIGAAMLWLFSTGVRNVLASRLHAERRQGRYVTVLVLEAALMLVLTALSLWLSPSTEAYLIGQAISAVLLVIILLLTTPNISLRIARLEWRASYFRQVLTYGAPFLPIGILAFLANQADRYTLGYLLGPATVGAYVAPFAIANRGMTLANAGLNDVLRPILFQAVNRGERATALRVMAFWIVARIGVSLAALGVLLVFGDLIARLLLAHEYRAHAQPVMLWVASAYALAGLSQTFENGLLSMDRSARLLLPMLFGAVSNVALSLWLIPAHGMVGAAQATCGSFAVQCLITGLGFWTAMQDQPPAGAVT